MRLQTNEDFLGFEGFGHVIDDTLPETRHDLLGAVIGGQENDGDVFQGRIRLHRFKNLMAVHLGHHHV